MGKNNSLLFQFPLNGCLQLLQSLLGSGIAASLDGVADGESAHLCDKLPAKSIR
ncbi:hypothetical protein TSUD_308360 [Trifolium subterraneum]|nr:hypothetical protein TSUD_308360 [Trifolium subterraneum]